MILFPTGQYPGEQGIVAPGMSCQFAVKFAPDSLTDYVDKIQVFIGVCLYIDDDVILLKRFCKHDNCLTKVLCSKRQMVY